jgi:hydantoinase/carbamoylase family amidase
VTDITGLFKWIVRLTGRPDHAGTTPMNMRRDALGGLAEFAAEIPRLIEENGSDVSVATIGTVRLWPGTANTVPGVAEFSLDVRDPDAAVLAELATATRKALSAIGRRRSLMFEFEIVSEIAPTQCDARIAGAVRAAAADLDVELHEMPSGAAHDAQMIAAIAPVGMIFAPSRDGRSHCPAEWTHWQDIALTANLALRAVQRLAGTADEAAVAPGAGR